MKQVDKQISLKDLCARLPYNCLVFYEYVDSLDGKTYGYSLTLNTWCIDEFVANKAVTKPYLRPMSSMTDEERKEYIKTCIAKFRKAGPGYRDNGWWEYHDTITSFDWLNAHHFDYRGLIEKGLAIEVTKENNPYEN